MQILHAENVPNLLKYLAREKTCSANVVRTNIVWRSSVGISTIIQTYIVHVTCRILRGMF